MKNKLYFIFSILFCIATLFMGVGYASINSITLNVNGEMIAQAQEGIFITNVEYLKRENALPNENATLNLTNGTMLNSTITLEPNDETSEVSIKVSFYNKYNYDFIFKDVIYDEALINEMPDIYSNLDITYTFDKQEEIIASKDVMDIIITFKYSNYDNSTLDTLNSILNFQFELVPVVVGSYNYSKGKMETLTIPTNGLYWIELWGARGGTMSDYNGGKGGYTSGNIPLKAGEVLYFYLGGKGNQEETATNTGGYNGGGYSGYNPSSENYNAGGGGSTDVRLVGGEWNNFNSLKSRIMVAAGGGGATKGEKGYYTGGPGGGLIGQLGEGVYTGTNSVVETTGATQTSGGTSEYEYNSSYGTNERNGKFGYAVQEITAGFGGGGGSGYYGGATSWGRGGSGGSSFISGHNGCDAILSTSTATNIIHSGQSIHYSGYTFTDTIMVDGYGYNWTTEKGNYTGMPNFNHTSTITGNNGSGYAKITLIKLN